ncbi:GatB/GatE catalytic domain family protein [Babesia bovis T2Bo]|uniref:PET112 family, N terminal region domain containing protein n=1 Tax=Babesia bovis TaxID=5865 RepID=A7AXC0_BABBO|nr:GatB/GatE catalytic domain family protein [Babesia bovis T2Bo]EDO05193.1 GatB/GatE catalytic domain family protein [Babesia bovis T2Bo]|eukprot:XP_001608761.1 PET112 family, N terminal region domain containing protein [Babesia bovis T2Bo]
MILLPLFSIISIYHFLYSICFVVRDHSRPLVCDTLLDTGLGLRRHSLRSQDEQLLPCSVTGDDSRKSGSGILPGNNLIFGGVEAHIQLSLPTKIFCSCLSTAGGVVLQPTGDINDTSEFPACQGLYRGLSSLVSSLLNTGTGDQNASKGMLSFRDYISVYSNLSNNVFPVAPSQLERFGSQSLYNSVGTNSLTCEVCRGEVGALPQLSPIAILYGLAGCHVFSCTPNRLVSFDRKVYSYPDLPKRYQLTQVHDPIGLNGRIVLGSGRKIPISRVNLEEDTARRVSLDALDYNRSGIGLLEVVTSPVECTVDELVECCSVIYRLSVTSGLSKGLMHEGNLRFDVNISNPSLGTKRVELKNLNSFRRIRRAVLQCISSESWAVGQHVPQDDYLGTSPSPGLPKPDNTPWNNFFKDVLGTSETHDIADPVGVTLKWRGDLKSVGYQRVKSRSTSYLNIRDVNIPTVGLEPTLFDGVTSIVPSNDDTTLDTLVSSYPSVSRVLMATIHNSGHSDLFLAMCRILKDPVLVANWLVNYIIPGLDADSSDAEQLCDVIRAVNDNRLNMITARRILADFLMSGLELNEFLKEHDLVLLDDETTRSLVDDYLLKHVGSLPNSSSITQVVRDIVAHYGYRLSYRTVKDHLLGCIPS